MSITSITIPQSLAKKGDLIIVERSEWEQLQKHLLELRHALKVIASGERELKTGKVIRAHSIDEALKLYGR